MAVVCSIYLICSNLVGLMLTDVLKRVLQSLLLVSLSVLPLWGLAIEDGESQSRVCGDDCVEVGQWQFNVGLGLGVRTNPLLDESDTPLVILPELSYYGKRFFFKNFDFGFTLFEDPKHQLNALMLPSRDQMYFNRWDPLNLFDPSGSGGFSGAPSVAGQSPGGGEDYQRFSVTVSNPTTSSQSSSLVSRPPESQSSSADFGSNDSLTGSASSEPASPETPSNGSSAPAGGGNGGVTASSSSASLDVIEIAYEGLSEISVNGEAVNFVNIQSGAPYEVGGISVTMSDGVLIIDTLEGAPADLSISAESLSISRNGAVVQADELGSVLEAGQVSVRAVNAEVSGDGNEGSVDGKVPAPGMDASDPGPLNLDGIRDRRVAILSGLEYSFTADSFIFHFQALRDISNAHDGTELRLAAILPFNLSSSRFAVTYGLNYQDSEVLDYYYGLNAQDRVHEYYYYKPDAGLSHMFRLDWQKPISDKWALRAMLQVTRLADQIVDSPLVEEDSVKTVFIGGVYYF